MIFDEKSILHGEREEGVRRNKTSRGDNLMMKEQYLEDIIWLMKEEEDFT